MNKKNFSTNKKAQSEMIGFAVIVILVSVLILIFIYFSVSSPKKDFAESKEVGSFIQASLEYSTQCDSRYELAIPIRKVIPLCTKKQKCYNGKDACAVLKEDLDGIINSSWGAVGPQYPIKGYNFAISYRGNEIYNNSDGNETSNSKGAEQPYPDGTNVKFIIYS